MDADLITWHMRRIPSFAALYRRDPADPALTDWLRVARMAPDEASLRQAVEALIDDQRDRPIMVADLKAVLVSEAAARPAAAIRSHCTICRGSGWARTYSLTTFAPGHRVVEKAALTVAWSGDASPGVVAPAWTTQHGTRTPWAGWKDERGRDPYVAQVAESLPANQAITESVGPCICRASGSQDGPQ